MLSGRKKVQKGTKISSEEENAQEKRKALLVSAFNGNDQRAICEEHLDELELLAETYGVEIVAKVPCLIRKVDAATFVTQGKLEELITLSKECAADLIIFDDEISPSQQRNLEKAFQLTVMDRTEVILEVFAQRAKTKEARLQIEYARVKYQAPRLKRLWSHLSRQHGSGGAGGGAYLKGEGEKQIEIDRRLIKKRLEQLQSEIQEVKEHREIQRVARTRSAIPVFALVGYTNAGKSTLLNALTDADVFVEDKLFATLDTTTRKFPLSTGQEVLVTDTVGFIRKLPHLLVAAFKSTLEEAIQADILLHVIDATHPMALEQARTTIQVLKELGVGDKPIITVLNKIDQAEQNELTTRLRLEYPRTVPISALHRRGFEELEEMMLRELSQQRKTLNLRIPQSEYALVSEIRRSGNVISQDYEENDVLIEVDLPVALANKLKNYVIS
ncbi:GTPase HflX [Parachlamydia acanthamoebae]|uniref:GTPase HflX n=1 Tax=Parachlamydia acanthamoebae TaxID=83552 RepID=A0A0C1C9Z6_9BACT|nr:GTPase HflX [Parachlamydia acanthamoebae]